MKSLNGFDKATLTSARNNLSKLVEFNYKDKDMKDFCDDLKNMIIKINIYLNYSN